jgi:hypothetical protein
MPIQFQISPIPEQRARQGFVNSLSRFNMDNTANAVGEQAMYEDKKAIMQEQARMQAEAEKYKADKDYQRWLAEQKQARELAKDKSDLDYQRIAADERTKNFDALQRTILQTRWASKPRACLAEKPPVRRRYRGKGWKASLRILQTLLN